jgi:hypothetical protein
MCGVERSEDATDVGLFFCLVFVGIYITLIFLKTGGLDVL